MTMTTSPPTTHLSIEETLIGPYVARVRVFPLDNDHRGTLAAEYEVSLRTLYSLRTHIDNAIDGLEHRRLVDAVCGDCSQCHNTRMVNVTRGGRDDWRDHCPVCRPKLLAFYAEHSAGV